MSDPMFTSAEKAALDRFDVPPLSAGFADCVVAASAGRAAPALPFRPSRARTGRGGWRRRAGIVTGGVALGLLSAAAAATGYLGEQARIVIRDTPVIGPIIAQVSPPPKPVRAAVKPAPKLPAMVAPVEDAARPLYQGRPEALVERIERRAESRKALGLPPVPVRRQIRQALRDMPPEQRREIVQRIRDMPPDERRALRQRVRELRRERMSELRKLREERQARWADAPPTEEAQPLPEN